jgi:hypothetical protein
MSGFFEVTAGVLQKLLGAVAPAAQIAEKVDPALRRSVSLTEVLNGVKAASGLPWVEIEKAVAEHFLNVQDDLSTIEDVAKAVAPFAPDALYVSDVASALLLLVKLSGALPPSLQILKTTPSLPLGKDGINPYSGAPVGV